FDWSRAQSGVHHASEIQPSTIHTARREAELPLVSAIEAVPATQPATSEAQAAEMFFVLYFFMTGLHAIHLIIGIALVGIIAYLSWRRWFSGGGATQIEVTGLYWHFIDIVWVFLYPMPYLIDVHS